LEGCDCLSPREALEVCHCGFILKFFLYRNPSSQSLHKLQVGIEDDNLRPVENRLFSPIFAVRDIGIGTNRWKRESVILRSVR